VSSRSFHKNLFFPSPFSSSFFLFFFHAHLRRTGTPPFVCTSAPELSLTMFFSLSPGINQFLALDPRPVADCHSEGGAFAYFFFFIHPDDAFTFPFVPVFQGPPKSECSPLVFIPNLPSTCSSCLLPSKRRMMVGPPSGLFIFFSAILVGFCPFSRHFSFRPSRNWPSFISTVRPPPAL